MLSVVIATLNDEARLAAGLGDLVAAAVDGVVREVVIADGGSTDATLSIAEDSGCRIVPAKGGLGARLAAGCETAKAEWLMVLPAGARLAHRWEESVLRFIDRGQAATSLQRTGSWLSLGVLGVLTTQALCKARGGYRDVGSPHAELLRRLGCRGALKILVSDPGGRR